MAKVIELGTPVRVGAEEKISIHITTLDADGGIHEREKNLRPGRFLFGEVTGGPYLVEREVLKPVLRKGKPVLDKESGLPKMKVAEPAKYTALVQWAGEKYRTSVLPVEMLTPASA